MKKRNLIKGLLRALVYIMKTDKGMDKVFAYLSEKYPGGMQKAYIQYREDKIEEWQLQEKEYPYIEKLIALLFRMDFIQYIPELEELDNEKKIEEQQQEKIRTEQLRELRIGQALQKDGDLKERVAHAVRFWKRTTGNIPYLAAYDYIPLSKDSNEKYKDEYIKFRKDVWIFKHTVKNVPLVHRAYILKELVEKLAYKLEYFFGEDLKCMTLVCIPASSNAVHQLRYREFSYQLCQATGMEDSMEHIIITGEKTPKHLGGETSLGAELDEEWFLGRHIILFDDIVTTGNSAEQMRDVLKQCGATVHAAVFMARTVSQAEKNGRRFNFAGQKQRNDRNSSQN